MKELRIKSGHTQADISSLLGIDQSLVSKYESGERQASVDTLEKLGDLYCCDMVHATPVDSPMFPIVVRADNIAPLDLEAIQVVNRVALNRVFMERLLKGN